MKNESFFSKIILLVILFIFCIVLTIGIALLAGTHNTTLFDFKNLNYENVIPVLLIGGFISCIAIGITVLFMAKSISLKIKKYLSDNNGGNQQ